MKNNNQTHRGEWRRKDDNNVVIGVFILYFYIPICNERDKLTVNAPLEKADIFRVPCQLPLGSVGIPKPNPRTLWFQESKNVRLDGRPLWAPSF